MREKRHAVGSSGLMLCFGIWLVAVGCTSGPVLFFFDTGGDDDSVPKETDRSGTDTERGRDTFGDTNPDAGALLDSGTHLDSEEPLDSDTYTDPGGSDDTAADAGDTERPDTEGVCDLESLLIPLNADGETVCAGALAERFFRFGLCTCEDATVFGDFLTDSFDSSLSSSALFDDFGGAVGVNKSLFVSGSIVVGGTAVFGNRVGVTFYDKTAVHGDLKAAGDVKFYDRLTVTRDARIDGSLVNFGPAAIDRDLYISGAILNPISVEIGGQRMDDSVAVTPPCPCGADEILDIAAIVEAGRNDNQNDEIGLDAGALAITIGSEDLRLECGRYYLNSVGGVGTVTLYVDGPTALFVGGDFNLAGDLDLVLGDNGEIDIFVAGDLALTGIHDADDMTRPSAVRFYVAGKKEVSLANVIGFNLYAPRARVTLSTDIYGSIFAGNFTSLDDSVIHYDRDIVSAKEQCDSGNIAGEVCEPAGALCGEDGDCCEPLICAENTCQPLMIII